MPPFCASQFLRVPLAAAWRSDSWYWYSGKFSIRHDFLFSLSLLFFLYCLFVSFFWLCPPHPVPGVETFQLSDRPIFATPPFFFPFGFLLFGFCFSFKFVLILGNNNKKLFMTSSTRWLKQRITAEDLLFGITGLEELCVRTCVGGGGAGGDGGAGEGGAVQCQFTFF